MYGLKRLALLASALVLPATAALAAPGVTTGNVNMREGPSTNYRVITTLPVNAPVEILGCAGWCEVEYRGRSGYVSGNYVSRVASAPPPVVVERDVYVERPARYYYDYYDRPSVGFYYYDRDDRRHWRRDRDWRRDRRDWRRDARREWRRDRREWRRDRRDDRRSGRGGGRGFDYVIER